MTYNTFHPEIVQSNNKTKNNRYSEQYFFLIYSNTDLDCISKNRKKRNRRGFSRLIAPAAYIVVSETYVDDSPRNEGMVC